MKTETLTLTPTQIKTLQNQLSAFDQRILQYTHFQAKLDDGHITAYTSGKVVFAGEMASHYAQQFKMTETITLPQAGSDEVGTGDYFGPMIVCACYVDETSYEVIKDLSILDSKQISDTQINQLAPLLMKQCPYSLLILDNHKYNQLHKTLNLNSLKAHLHQKAYDHLRTKLGKLPKLCVVDQFTPKKSYFNYLKEDYGITHLHFETKAESKYISVACASIIARYHFLLALKQLSKKYNCNFPKGAGPLVNSFLAEFVAKYGKEELNKVAKVHFKNTSLI